MLWQRSVALRIQCSAGLYDDIDVDLSLNHNTWLYGQGRSTSNRHIALQPVRRLRQRPGGIRRDIVIRYW